MNGANITMNGARRHQKQNHRKKHINKSLNIQLVTMTSRFINLLLTYLSWYPRPNSDILRAYILRTMILWQKILLKIIILSYTTARRTL